MIDSYHIPGLLPYTAPGYDSTLYVRPAGAAYGTGSGDSYENALAGFASIVWGSVAAGTRILICDTHNESLIVGASGTEAKPIIIQAQEPGVSGIVDSQNTRNVGVQVSSKNYIHVDGITSKNAVVSCFETSGTSTGIVYNNCKGQSSGNQAWQSLNTASATYYGIEGTDCTDDGFSMHGNARATIHGGVFLRNAEGINIISASQLVGYNVVSEDNTLYGLYITQPSGVLS